MKYFHDIFSTQTDSDGVEYLNLTKSINISDLVSDIHLEDYVLIDGQTPSRLSNDIYGTTEYWWINLLVNNVKDPYYEWPMSDTILRSYFQYLIDEGEISGTPSDWTALKLENDNKRKIKILKSEYVDPLIALIQKVVDYNG